jgi:hypothetical protein
MELHHWIGDHGFDLLEAAAIIASLTFTAVSFRRDDRSRRVENLLTLTQSHRDVWKEQLRDPKLRRVLEAKADLAREPVTRAEEIFVTLVVQHLNIVFHALRDELTIQPEGLRRDVWQFLSLPIPQAVWNQLKPLQNDAFVAFVEACRNWK